MLKYYLALAWRDLLRQPGYALLMAVILGLGVGIFMTTYSLLYVLSGDPVPSRSDRLLSLSMGAPDNDGEPVGRMPELYVRSIRRALPQIEMVAMGNGYAAIETDSRQMRQPGLIRFTESRFFDVFDVPVVRGRAWNQQEDEQGGPVALIGQTLARALFGSDAVLGRTLQLGGASFRIIGVVGPWRPTPRYYDLSIGAYAPADDLYLPRRSLRYLREPIFVSRTCPFDAANPDVRELGASRCSWLTLWALLDSRSQRETVQARLQQVAEQGRNEGWLDRRRSAVKVENVVEMLQRLQVVPGGVRYGVLVAASFLLLCLVNAAGLLLAKYMRRTREIGIRRALGAARRDIILQFSVDALLIGAISSVFGMVFTLLGVKSMQLLPQPYLQLATFNGWIFLLTLLGSGCVGVLAGLFPAWRASGVEPAIQVKVD